jgi:hypothetical protein
MRKAMIFVLLLLCSALPFAASTSARSVDVDFSMLIQGEGSDLTPDRPAGPPLTGSF